MIFTGTIYAIYFSHSISEKRMSILTDHVHLKRKKKNLIFSLICKGEALFTCQTEMSQDKVFLYCEEATT